MPAPSLIPPLSGGGGVGEKHVGEEKGEKQEKKYYSWGDISVHNSLDDCWVVFQGKVYDVTSWVPKHPGGNIIGLAAGREATALLYSYHSNSIVDILKKYYIGEVKDYESFYTYDSPFYKTVKERVAKLMRDQHLSRSHSQMYFKGFVVLSLYFLSYYLSLVLGYVPMAIVFGFFHAQIGFNIMHDGCHGAYSDNSFLCKLAGRTMELIGSSSLVWQYQHNVGHHPNSNNNITKKEENKLDPLAFDPDAVAGSPMVRMNPNLPQKWVHKYQHVYIWFLIMFNNFKWFVNDIRALKAGKYKEIDFGKVPKGEFEFLAISKIVYLFYSLFIPVYLHGFSGLFMFYLFMITSGYTSILFFGVNHLTDEAEFPHAGFAAHKRDWAILQVLTSSNFATHSPIWTAVTGGLNFQIEHHLFPAINHTHLPRIAPVVRQACQEFGVPYHAFPTFWAALYSYYSHLKQLGIAEVLKQD